MKRFFLYLLSLILVFSVSGCATGKSENSAKTPAPTSAPAFQEKDEPYFGRLGDQKLYDYFLACTYRATVDEFVKKQRAYDETWDMETYFDFTARILDETDPVSGRTNREQLQQQALQKCLYMVVIYSEALNIGLHIADHTEASLRTRWEKYGNQCYGRLKDSYDYVRDADTGMEVMAGGTVAEVIEYMIIQTVVSQFTANWFYKNDSTNKDFAAYYQEHIRQFRQVTARVVYIQDPDQAETVRKQMLATPEHIANLARAYNEDKNLARDNGLLTITSETATVPQEVREWAYKQSEETSFYETGAIDIVSAADGCYLLMCETVTEYRDDLNNEVYRTVGAAYKTEQLNAYLEELLAGDAYRLTDYDEARAFAVMDGSFKV